MGSEPEFAAAERQGDCKHFPLENSGWVMLIGQCGDYTYKHMIVLFVLADVGLHYHVITKPNELTSRSSNSR
jgi:hypothetical protein